ncbi:hypothetical protein HU675_0045365 [Bradyrhizobium septentrionale]|uniref:hypothetical protein n=1 Tax=Bradyrhizobium septentrionale TaxID=1404411 RepID=UPI001CD35799|nr:hypothetical protein [Bradyrhizobium septentrionale]UGY25023.1 hypothetical protein HU675_0045365 [Bradyrhizobium septentrionale]
MAIEDDHARVAILMRDAAALPLPAGSHGPERLGKLFSCHGSPSNCLHGSADESARWSVINGVTEGAQLIRAGGNPISHETKSGFNAPHFPVDATVREIELITPELNTCRGN